MKRKVVSILLIAAMCVTVLAGCRGGSDSSKEGSSVAKDEDNTLEFYHGYYQDESEWAAAQVMRDIYDQFAAHRYLAALSRIWWTLAVPEGR